jgi:hypothetical protein
VLFDRLLGKGDRGSPAERAADLETSFIQPDRPLPAGRVCCLKNALFKPLAFHRRSPPPSADSRRQMFWFNKAGADTKTVVFEFKLGTQPICQRAHELKA